jgi:hypothetical protein
MEELTANPDTLPAFNRWARHLGVDSSSQFKVYLVVYVGGHHIRARRSSSTPVTRRAVLDPVKIELITLSLQKESKNMTSKITCMVQIKNPHMLILYGKAKDN